MKVKKEERGYGGHFIGADRCLFRRNTLLTTEDKMIVISTVGAYLNPLSNGNRFMEIGCNRYYETMAFEANYEAPYWETDIRKILDFESHWCIDHIGRETDFEADQMHEMVVQEFVDKLKDK